MKQKLVKSEKSKSPLLTCVHTKERKQNRFLTKITEIKKNKQKPCVKAK